jgi:hypothetical protein
MQISVIEQPGHLELKWRALCCRELLQHVPLPAMLTLGDVLAIVPVDGSDRGLLTATFISASELLHRTPHSYRLVANHEVMLTFGWIIYSVPSGAQ